MKNRTVLDVTLRICFAILVFFFLTIMIRFFTRNVLVEILGWNNAFTKIIFLGDEAMGDAPNISGEGGEVKVEVNWEDLYPFKNAGIGYQDTVVKLNAFGKYTSLVESVENKIGTYTDNMLLGHMQLTRLGKKYNSLIGCEAMPMNSNGQEIIILNNGYMTYAEPLVGSKDMELLANNVSDFSNYLEEKGITFIYANAGSKVCDNDRQLPAGSDENTNENADELIRRLNEQNVNVLDYRPLQEANYSDWYDTYYITDHHWKTTTGLWAAGEMAKVLNEKAGFNFDISIFNENNYTIESRDGYFLGGQGRILTTAVAELESFSTVFPKFETDLSIQIPTRSIDQRGRYDNTLFRKDFYESISAYSLKDFETKEDTYHSTMWKNDALGTVQNNLETNNEGKRILMIQDSFGWYLSTFLALDVAEIDFINLNGFTGSIRTYIEETKPDVVVLLLCERNIKPITDTEMANHTHFFDFR